MTDRQWWVVLIAICGLGLVLRFILLNHQSLWLDDALAIRRATQGRIAGLVQFGAQAEPSPPLYFVLLHYWLTLWGTSATAARALSAICGALTLPALAWLLAPSFGRMVAVVAVALLAISPFHVYYSQEVRPYSLLVLLFVLSTHYFIVAVRDGGRRRWWTHWAATTACVFTHYIGVAAIVGQGLYVFRRRRQIQGTIRPALISMFGTVCCAGIWTVGPRFFNTVGDILRPHETAAQSLSRIPFIWLHTVWDIQFGYFPGLEHASPNLLSFMLGVSLVILVMVAASTVRGFRSSHGDSVWLLLLLSVGALTVGTGVVATSFFKHSRYFLPLLPVALALESLALIDFWRRLQPLAFLAGAGILVINSISLGNYYLNPTYARPDWRSLAQCLNRETRPGDIVVLPLYFYDGPLDIYYHGAAAVTSLKASPSTLSQMQALQRRRLLRSGCRYWLIRVANQSSVDLSTLGVVRQYAFHDLGLIRLTPAAPGG